MASTENALTGSAKLQEAENVGSSNGTAARSLAAGVQFDGCVLHWWPDGQGYGSCELCRSAEITIRSIGFLERRDGR